MEEFRPAGGRGAGYGARGGHRPRPGYGGSPWGRPPANPIRGGPPAWGYYGPASYGPTYVPILTYPPDYLPEYYYWRGNPYRDRVGDAQLANLIALRIAGYINDRT
jgi:hypothetical protein